MLANRTAGTLQQQAWSQCSSRHRSSLLGRPTARCAATKTRSPASGKKVKKEQAPIALPDSGAIEQANASDALFTVRPLSEVLSGGASVHNSICGTTAAAAAAVINWSTSLPWAIVYADVSLHVTCVVCMYMFGTRAALADRMLFLACSATPFNGTQATSPRQNGS
jgi:hypothetical protein